MGTRLSEETNVRPKPLVEIGGQPILWHIMKLYSAHGLHDFVVCLGYKGYLIKEYFANYFLHMSDVTINIGENRMEVHDNKAEPWKITLIDTGQDTQTGGRIKRIAPYLDGADFCLTYGDGLGDVDIRKTISFHREHKLLATVTGVLPPGRFGAISLNGHVVRHFQEKPLGDGAYINGGFFVLSPRVLDYIDGDPSIWEQEPMRKLADEGQMAAYRHDGFWQPMDTLRDRTLLEDLWRNGAAPWKVW